MSLHRSALHTLHQKKPKKNRHCGQFRIFSRRPSSEDVTRNFASLSGSTFPAIPFFSFIFFSLRLRHGCGSDRQAPALFIYALPTLFAIPILPAQMFAPQEGEPSQRHRRTVTMVCFSRKLSQVIFLWLGVPNSGSKHSGGGMVHLAALWCTSTTSSPTSFTSSFSSSKEDIFQCRAQRSFVLGVIDRGKPRVRCNDLKGDV